MRLFRIAVRTLTLVVLVIPAIGYGQSAADLSVTKTDAPDPVATGANITYTVTFTNNGPGTVAVPNAHDHLPPGVTLVAAFFTPSQSELCFAVFNFDGSRNFDCAMDPLPVGGSVVWTAVVTVNVPAGSVVTNTASVSALANADPVAGNNTATTTTQVVAVAPATPTLSAWALLALIAALGTFSIMRVR
jgi:uncharacterized repeat protein (TIGR01451 family)